MTTDKFPINNKSIFSYNSEGEIISMTRIGGVEGNLDTITLGSESFVYIDGTLAEFRFEIPRELEEITPEGDTIIVKDTLINSQIFTYSDQGYVMDYGIEENTAYIMNKKYSGNYTSEMSLQDFSEGSIDISQTTFQNIDGSDSLKSTIQTNHASEFLPEANYELVMLANRNNPFYYLRVDFLGTMDGSAPLYMNVYLPDKLVETGPNVTTEYSYELDSLNRPTKVTIDGRDQLGLYTETYIITYAD
jgi:hypothetical protein